MRHRKGYKELGRWPAHRKALLRNLVASLFLHEKIETTYTRAKAAQRLAEKLITTAKEDTVAARRLVAEYIPNPLRREVVTKLFTEIAPRYKERNGGYTRVIKAGARQGDAAEMAVLMLVE
ncbi:50S ribosomal protein L17 [bacterium HR17]|uniref:Large ribosomal subunit protein bL17 n=1 Tax=Candidatus Fervidibacter japonicus TaxID=2035412 RepID=A0A2H5XDM3_9BACT|nr:50S ribosomal protein L17 [bacterium HR17]